MNTTPGPLDGAPPFSHLLRPADLPTARATEFELVPDQAQCDAIAADLRLPRLRKLRFAGSLAPLGKRDWQMTARLGATVVQDCVVTLAPVTTRIEDTVKRRWLHQMAQPDHTTADAETEMPEDDSADPLSSEIDLGQVMIEALALALPLYPRADGAKIETSVFTQPGTKPMTDEDAKPFAGLSDLRDRLSGGEESD